MTYSFQPKGVCSREMTVELDEQGIIRHLSVIGGCDGNLQGISALVVGMPAAEAVQRLQGIHCGPRATSCPDQLAKGLAEILSNQ